MDNPTPALLCTFSALASDIKLDILDFVRSKSDQGNARLVSREWNRLMRPRMWRSFTTSMLGTFAQNLDKLPEEKKACFYGIRTLTVGGSGVGSDYDTCLSTFQNMLRDNQLLEFSSATESPVHAMQLLTLLRHQSNLSCFRARLDVSTAITEEMKSLCPELTLTLTSALCWLKTLRIYVADGYMEGDNEQALHRYEVSYNGLLTKVASRLDCLEICGWRRQGMPPNRKVPLKGLYEYATHSVEISTSLRHLVLANLEISGAEDSLMSAINLNTLSSLRFEYSDRLGYFLRLLATALSRQTKSTLKVLTVRNSPYSIAGENDCMRGAFDDLLCSFGSLEELECSYIWAPYVNWKLCLGRHPRLKKLLVSSMQLSDGWPNRTETIAEILASCPTVQNFAYSPPTPYFGYIESCELPSTLSRAFHESLDAVATASALHTLRVIYAPGIGEDSSNRQNTAWIEKAAQVAQRFATLILTHLHLKGSNIRVLSLSEESRWKQMYGDSNLHFYPHYFYRLHVADHDGQKNVSAIPLRDYVAECPEVEIFT